MHETTGLTAEQITLVQASFARVLPIADSAAALFYGRLFELDPALRQLFKGDSRAQGRKLMTMLATVVNRLHRLPELLPTIHELGARHQRYGVNEQHYATVGAALLWTLEQGLGEHWTPAMQAAWARTYAVLSAAMQHHDAELVDA